MSLFTIGRQLGKTFGILMTTTDPQLIEDSEGISFTDKFQLLWCSEADGLGFCGCGDPEEMAGLLLVYLHTVAWLWEDDAKYYQDRIEAKFEFAQLTEKEWTLLAYIADNAGFTEHGGNLVNAWLSDKGKKFKEALRAVLPVAEAPAVP